jgi:alkanesulfonate monooxygenase SsuD/methylene tetrahydromethanopterin reductase-like flavin-dependent oxidoreductase (luciferase family)
MKFAHFSHVWNRPGMTAAQRYELLWRELELCDELGYDYGFAVEHHFSPEESWMASPAIYCAGAAQHTKRMRIGPMGYIVALYDPLRIVEEAAMLDNVLNGRLELGLVSGILPKFFRPYKADFQNRRILTEEALALVQTAFTSDGSFDFSGPVHSYEAVSLSVKPLQKPYPPIWIQSRDLETLRLLAEQGVHTGSLFFMPRQEVAPRYRQYLEWWAETKHPYQPNIGYWSLVYVDETDEKARAEATQHVIHAFTKVFGFGDGGGVSYLELAKNFEKRGELGAAEIARNVADIDFLMDRKLMFIGSPDTVIQQIREAATEGLFNTLMCEFNIGFLAEDKLIRSIELFAREVMPALRDFEPC